MRLRSGLVGVVGVVVVAGMAAGKPPDLPVDPLPEGREPDPVAREFYQPIPPAGARAGYAAPPRTPTVEDVVDAIRGWLTFPLGLVVTQD